jgi:predicted MPP superfamily phosphohydrolase
MTEKNELQDELIEALKPLKAEYGIYAVFGAHDYYNKKPQEFIKNMFKKKESYSRKNDFRGLRKKLESTGINVLQN